MISKDYFENKIREAINLLDSKISKKTVELIYEKIKDDFEDEDLKKAIDIATETDNLNYPFLLKIMRESAMERQRRQYMEQKRREEEESYRFWREQRKGIRQTSCNRICYLCQVKYCDLVAQRAIEGIKRILTGEEKVTEVNKRLATEFKGIGFEDEGTEITPF